MAIAHFFGTAAPIRTVPCDPEANPANYRGSKMIAYEPLWQQIYVGMRVALTRNINKDMDYVNGMTAVVLGAYRHGIRVKTETGYEPVIYPWTDEYKNTFFPMRAGYSNTLLKMQGATLDHATTYLYRPGV